MAATDGVLVEETVGVRGGHFKEIAFVKDGKWKQDGEEGGSAREGMVFGAENREELPAGAQRLGMEDRDPGHVGMPTRAGVGQ